MNRTRAGRRFRVTAPRAAAVTAALAALTAAGTGCGTSSDDARAPGDRPDILVYLIDTLRADRLGSYGCPTARSPELDRFARQGVQFSRAYAPSSW